MKRILAFLALLPAALLGAAYDVSVQQVNSYGTAYAPVIISPGALTIWGFNSSKQVINVTMGTNLSVSVGGALTLGPALSGLTTIANSGAKTTTITAIGSTSTDGDVLTNTTAAANGAQQWSPRIHMIGQGWATNTGGSSQTVDFVQEVQPVQGTANPSGNLVISAQVNGAGYSAISTLTNAGQLELPVGSSGAPSYSFPGGQSNYGMYYSSSAIYFTANGSNVLHLDSAKLATFAGGVTLSGSNIITTPNITMGSGTGTVSATSGVFSVTSDARAKNIRGSFTAGLDSLAQLKPVFFDFKFDPKHVVQPGFTAQNVWQGIPAAVFYDSPNGLRSVSDRGILAAVVNGVNELADRPNTLEIRLFEAIASLAFVLSIRANLKR